MPQNVFPYPGNKARHSEWIISHLPEHTCYVEPFGGAAGVLFNKPKSKVEVYNDINDDIVHFFRVLREQPEELKEWLSRVPFSRTVHEEWKEEFYNGERRDDDIERAGIFFALRRMQFGGKFYGTSGFMSSPHRNFAGQFVRNTERLEYFADRLKEVCIENLDWRVLLERYDSDEAVFYIDPPYEDTEYQYDSEGFNHGELYRAVCELEGRCLISYDSIPHWYGDGFEVVSKSTHFTMNDSDHKSGNEFLIMNFDSDGQPLMSGVGQQGLDAFAD